MKKILILICLLIAMPCFAMQGIHRHIEHETVAYYSLGSNDGTTQFTLNEQIKSIKYLGGTVTLAGLTNNLSLVNGTAFVTNPSVDLRKWVGFKISLTETTHTLIGYVKAAGTGTTLSGTEQLSGVNWATGGYVWNGGFVTSGLDITTAIDTTGDTGNDGRCSYRFASPTQYALYYATANPTINSGTLGYIIVGSTTDLSLSGGSYVSSSPVTSGAKTFYFTNINATTYFGYREGGVLNMTATGHSIKQVLTPSATGVTIWDKSANNWVSGTTTILPNAASFTAVISLN